MNRTDFAGKLATKMGTTRKEAEAFAKLYEETLTEALVEGEKVALTGFLTYEIVDVDATERRNPKTGETFMADAHKKVKVKVGKVLKDAVR